MRLESRNRSCFDNLLRLKLWLHRIDSLTTDSGPNSLASTKLTGRLGGRDLGHNAPDFGPENQGYRGLASVPLGFDN